MPYDPDNQQHFLRRWGRDNIAAVEPMTLTAEEVRKLAEAVNQAFRGLDGFWETIAGRKLTPEEKGER